MRPTTAVYLIVGVMLSLASGYLNTHTDELMVVVPFLFAATFGLGVVRPKSAWLGALLVGLAVPVSQGVAYTLQLHVPYPNDLGGVATSAVAVIPAFIGAYLGVAIRHLSGDLSRRSTGG